MIREEARLSSAKSREVVPQEAIGFVSRKEEHKDEQTARRDTSHAARTENNGSGFGNRARDRVCSNCGKSEHEKHI